jgi:hypothetical protein
MRSILSHTHTNKHAPLLRWNTTRQTQTKQNKKQKQLSRPYARHEGIQRQMTVELSGQPQTQTASTPGKEPRTPTNRRPGRPHSLSLTPAGIRVPDRLAHSLVTTIYKLSWLPFHSDSTPNASVDKFLLNPSISRISKRLQMVLEFLNVHGHYGANRSSSASFRCESTKKRTVPFSQMRKATRTEPSQSILLHTTPQPRTSSVCNIRKTKRNKKKVIKYNFQILLFAFLNTRHGNELLWNNGSTHSLYVL